MYLISWSRSYRIVSSTFVVGLDEVKALLSLEFLLEEPGPVLEGLTWPRLMPWLSYCFWLEYALLALECDPEAWLFSRDPAFRNWFAALFAED